MGFLDKFKKDKFKKVEPQNVEVQSVSSDPTAFYPSPQQLPELPQEQPKIVQQVQQVQPLKLSTNMLTDIATGVMQSIQEQQQVKTYDTSLEIKLKNKLQDIHIENIVNQKLEAALKSLL